MAIDDPNNQYHPAEVSYLTDEKPEIRERFFERLDQVPQVISAFCYTQRTHDRIKALSEQFQLKPTQILFLTCVIRDIAVGFKYFGDMVEELKNQLDLPEDTAKKIAVAITNDVYDFALEDIKKLQVATFPDRIKQSMEKSENNVLNLRDGTF